MPLTGSVNLFYGVHDTRDLEVEVNTLGQAEVANWMADVLAQYEQMSAEVRSRLIARQTTNYIESMRREASGFMQPADEYSRPDIRRVAGKYLLRYPLEKWQDATGWTDDYLEYATVLDLAQDALAQAQRDQNTLMRSALRALLRSDTWTFEDPIWGSLAIQPLLNGDGTIPPEYFGTTFAGSHTHYVASAGAAIANADFVTIYNHLYEHGLSGNIVVWIPKNLEASVRALTTFVEVPDPRLQQPTTGTYAIVSEAQAIGRINHMDIVVKPYMPDNYLFAWDKTSGPPLVERIPDKANLRGLRVVAQERSYPLRNSMWERRFGFGVANRINGVAMFVTAGGAYVNPTTLVW